MARTNADPELILERIAARLIDQLEGVSAANCFAVLAPTRDAVPNAADFIYHVSLVSGQFDSGAFDGGGNEQATVHAQLAVTIWSTRDLDQVGRDRKFLVDPGLGLLPKAKKVLLALSGHDLEDESGNELLDQPFFPADFHIERLERNLGSIQIGFSIVFDWDL